MHKRKTSSTRYSTLHLNCGPGTWLVQGQHGSKWDLAQVWKTSLLSQLYWKDPFILLLGCCQQKHNQYRNNWQCHLHDPTASYVPTGWNRSITSPTLKPQMVEILDIWPTTLWMAITCAQLLSHVRLFATVAHQDPLSMGFSWQEYWIGLPFPPPGDLLDSGIKPTSLVSPAWAGRFFTTRVTWYIRYTGWEFFP